MKNFGRHIFRPLSVRQSELHRSLMSLRQSVGLDEKFLLICLRRQLLMASASLINSILDTR